MFQALPFSRDGGFDLWSGRLLSLLPILGIALVVYLLGWPVPAAMDVGMITLLRWIGGLYGGLVWLRWALIAAPHWQGLRSYLFGPGLALLILAAAIFEPWIADFLATHWTVLPLHGWLVVLAAVQQFLAFFSRFLDWLPQWEHRFFSRANPGLVLVLTFGLLIILGMFLLKVPNATTEGISWLDALFTSTSAVCVTGLIVVDTATAFTPLGQGIILLLIQLGAFGIVTLTFFLAIISGQGFSVSSRVFLRDLLSVDNMRNLSATIATIIGLTLLFELVGAVLLYWLWSGDFAAGGEAWWIAIFHSISAFCNAGFSIFTNGLADPRAVDARGAQAVILGLIVLGGIGFPVLLEIGQRLPELLPWRKRPCVAFFSLHTRLVLILTGLFILGGALLLLGGSGGTGSYWEALFNSITARTAGFNISDMAGLSAASTAIIMLLMFIGGSPGGIAGGIKTTTFAIAVLNLRRILLNRRDVQMFGRRVADEVSNRAFAVVLLSIIWIFTATAVLLYLQPEFALIDTLFEVVSAFSTVGLSRGLTSELSEPAKCVITLTMLVGRIGVLNFFFSLVSASRTHSHVRYPQERIIIE